MAISELLAFKNRSVIDLLSAESVNVRNFGTKADGVTDDTAAIQAAIDYASANDSGLVFIPSGEYLVNHTIHLPSDIHLMGAGRKSLLKFDTNVSFDQCLITIRESGNRPVYPMFITDNSTSGIVLSNFRIEGYPEMSKTDMTYMGISMNNTTKFQIIDMEVHEINFWGDGLETRGWGIAITGSTYGIVRGGFFSHCGYENIGIRDASSHIIVTETVHEEGCRCCIQAVSCSYSEITHNVINGNENAHTDYDDAIAVHNSNNIVVDSNIIYHNAPTQTLAGIQIVGNTNHVTVSNNIINCVLGKAILINYPTPDTKVIGNKCYTASGQVISALSSDNLFVQGNTFESANSTDNNTYFANCQNLVVDGNYVKSSALSGICVTSDGGTSAKGARVTNNTISAPVKSIRLTANVTNCIVAHNRCMNAQYAVETTTGATNNVISENSFLNISVANTLVTEAATTTIINNV
jgi:hypothetical protein